MGRGRTPAIRRREPPSSSSRFHPVRGDLRTTLVDGLATDVREECHRDRLPSGKPHVYLRPTRFVPHGGGLGDS